MQLFQPWKCSVAFATVILHNCLHDKEGTEVRSQKSRSQAGNTDRQGYLNSKSVTGVELD